MDEYSEIYGSEQPWMEGAWGGSYMNDVLLNPVKKQYVGPDKNYEEMSYGNYVPSPVNSSCSLTEDGYESVLARGEQLLKTPLINKHVEKIQTSLPLPSSVFNPVSAFNQVVTNSPVIDSHTVSSGRAVPQMSVREELPSLGRRNILLNPGIISNVSSCGENVGYQRKNVGFDLGNTVNSGFVNCGGTKPKQPQAVPGRQPRFDLHNDAGSTGYFDGGLNQNRRFPGAPQLNLPHVRGPFPQVYPQIIPPTYERVTSARPQKPVVLPDKYDGSIAWQDYQAHFELCADLSAWTDRQKANYLAVSLRGPAQELLGDMSMEMRQNYGILSEALCARFGSEGQTELFRTQLKTRQRKSNESLPELAQSIRRLVSRAYPEATLSLRDILSKDSFIEALNDSEIRLRLKQSKPSNLEETVKLAIELEAFQTSENERRSKKYVRLTQTEEGLNQTALLEKIAKQLEKLTLVNKDKNEPKAQSEASGKNKSQKSDTPIKRDIRCYKCQEYGHIQWYCPKEDKVVKKDQKVSSDQKNTEN